MMQHHMACFHTEWSAHPVDTRPPALQAQDTSKLAAPGLGVGILR